MLKVVQKRYALSLLPGAPVWILAWLLLASGCSSVQTTPRLLTLDAGGKAVWQRRVPPRAGSLVLGLAGHSAEACDRVVLRIRLANDREFQANSSISISLSAWYPGASLRVVSDHYSSETILYRSYLDSELLADNTLSIAWNEQGELLIRVNNEWLVQGESGKRFRYIQILAQQGVAQLSYLSSAQSLLE